MQAINKKESSSQYLADLEKIRKAYVQDVKENYSTTSIPDSAPQSNSFDENSSKNADSGGRMGKARFGEVFYDINLEVDSYLPHTNNSASDINESTSMNSISYSAPKSNSFDKNSSKNGDSGGIVALADSYFDRYGGDMNRTTMRQSMLEAARGMLDSL